TGARDDGSLWVARITSSGEIGRPRRLTVGPTLFRSFVASADGSKIFAIGTNSRRQLARYDIAKSRFVPMWDGHPYTPERRIASRLTGSRFWSPTQVMNTLASDFRYAARELRRRPSFTLTAIVSLALGVGATSAVFSVIYAVLINPFPYVGADRIMQIALKDK